MKPAPRKGSVVAAGPTGLKSSLQAAAPKQGNTAASPKSPKRTSWAMRPAEPNCWGAEIQSFQVKNGWKIARRDGFWWLLSAVSVHMYILCHYLVWLCISTWMESGKYEEPVAWGNVHVLSAGCLPRSGGRWQRWTSPPARWCPTVTS